MADIQIYDWNEIEERFTHGLLLGNGGSIAVDKSFLYPSLFEYAYNSGLITEEIGKIFDYFGNDFELILRMLMYATEVNQALGVEDKKTENAYGLTRKALIETVRQIHPEHHEVTHLLPIMAKFLGKFDTILSLNYDLLVYWARLSKHETGVTFKDCYVGGGQFDDDWKRFREPLPREDKIALVFYPHGNLALTTDLRGIETKITTKGHEGNDLLDKIFKAWESKKLSPLFICEGTQNRKIDGILGNSYLRTVYEEVLKDIGESLVIYGCSLSEADDHLLDKLTEGDLRRIAVAVNRAEENLQKNCQILALRIQEKFRRNRIFQKKFGDTLIDVIFFDRESKNCWVHSA